MQQLTLQFEGFAGSAQPVDVAATTRRRVINQAGARATHGTSPAHAWNTAVPRMAQSEGTRRCTTALHALQVIARIQQRVRHAQVAEVLEGMAVIGASVIVILMAAVLQGGAA